MAQARVSQAFIIASLVFITTLLILHTPSVLAQAVGFAPVVVYPSGGYQAVSVATADVNADARPDLIVANLCSAEPAAKAG